MHYSEKTEYLSQLIQHQYILWPHSPEGMIKSKNPIYHLYGEHDSLTFLSPAWKWVPFSCLMINNICVGFSNVLSHFHKKLMPKQYYYLSTKEVSRLKNGEGNGNPLQYSCLENPTDGGAWWAAVHGVARSWTWLKRLSSSSSSSRAQKRIDLPTGTQLIKQQGHDQLPRRTLDSMASPLSIVTPCLSDFSVSTSKCQVFSNTVA